MEPTEALLPAFVPRPAQGRVFTPPERAVRSTDATPTGRLRLDAVARYLQEAAEDDLADARLRERTVWLVRRFALAIRGAGVAPAPYLHGVKPVAELINSPNIYSVIVAVLAGIAAEIAEIAGADEVEMADVGIGHLIILDQSR